MGAFTPALPRRNCPACFSGFGDRSAIGKEAEITVWRSVTSGDRDGGDGCVGFLFLSRRDKERFDRKGAGREPGGAFVARNGLENTLRQKNAVGGAVEGFALLLPRRGREGYRTG